MKVLEPLVDGTPMLLANGVQYSKEEFEDMNARIRKFDYEMAAVDTLCCYCEKVPCIAVASGDKKLIDYSKSLRERGHGYLFLHDICFKRLLNTETMQQHLKDKGLNEPPPCCSVWVDKRCCLGLNW